MSWTKNERAYNKMCIKQSEFANVNFSTLQPSEREKIEARLEKRLDELEEREAEFSKMRDTAKFQDLATEFYTGF